MEVLNHQEALLTNYEALLVIQEEDARHKEIKTSPHHRYPENVMTLKFEALQYLNNTPCTSQTAEQIASVKQKLIEYELTKAEILQIINLRPTAPVELHLIIEECEERFEMNDLEEMINIVATELPREEGDDEESTAEDEANDENENENENAEEEADEDEDIEMAEDDSEELIHSNDKVVDEPADAGDDN